MADYVFADYSNSLLNMMASIRSYFGLKHNHTTLKVLDKELEKGYRSVIILLLDGMGSYIMDKHLDKNSFLQANKACDFSTVFPSTTACATTVVTSSKSPIETGWLGWHQYFKEVDHDVVMFMGSGYYDKKQEDVNPSSIYVPYKKFVDELKGNNINATSVYPSWSKENPARTKRAFFRKIRKFANSGNYKQYMYAYHGNPDTTMHETGTMSKKTHKVMLYLNKKVEKLASKLPDDCLLIVTADHGHHDVKEFNLIKYPDFTDTLVRLPAIDSRNSTFYVKKDKDEEFRKLFDKYFGKYFLLIPRKEVLDKELFGPGIPHKKSLDFIGDYQAVSISDYMFSYNEDPDFVTMKSAHAGILKDEMIIPLILVHK